MFGITVVNIRIRIAGGVGICNSKRLPWCSRAIRTCWCCCGCCCALIASSVGCCRGPGRCRSVVGELFDNGFERTKFLASSFHCGSGWLTRCRGTDTSNCRCADGVSGLVQRWWIIEASLACHCDFLEVANPTNSEGLDILRSDDNSIFTATCLLRAREYMCCTTSSSTYTQHTRLQTSNE